jgi:hypothetical protein
MAVASLPMRQHVRKVLTTMMMRRNGGDQLRKRSRSGPRIVARLGVALLASILPLAITGSAQAGTPETIHTFSVVTNPISASPPYLLDDNGTFTASGAFEDSGTYSAQLMFAAVASPVRAEVKVSETLIGADGSTLTLRCNWHADDFSNIAHIPFRGTCAVLSGTGRYETLRGSGQVTGIVDDVAATFSVTVVLARG